MASTHLDEFVLNFDLSQLQQPSEANVKTVEQKYERLRKNLHIVKSTIITSHYLLQKYNTKKEEHEQLVKAHAATREELTQICIKYKDILDKCASLENDNKVLLASQEKLKEGKVDSDNKYCALISHTNQLQLLVKQLETEKDALKVEKELEKCNEKERTQEVIQLQREKAAMLVDLIALKDVILGKKKSRKEHIKLFKKYVKDIICKDTDMPRSDESDDDMDRHDKFVLHTPQHLKTVLELADKEMSSSAEQNFVDNCSDASNGEVSVDTGRGSSRANSHDKHMSSPDYIFTSEDVLKRPHKNIKQMEVANSPITVYPPRSAATSPVIFNDSSPLFEDQYNDDIDCFDGSEIIFDSVGLSEELDKEQQQDRFVDVCTSPIPNVPQFTDSGTDPIKNYEFMSMEPTNKPTRTLSINERNECDESNEYSQKQSERCFCGRDNDKKKFVDSCTSPIPKSFDNCRFVEKGTSTVNSLDSLNLDGWCDLQNHTSRYCEQSSCTETIIQPNRKYVDAHTSPMSKHNGNISADKGTYVNIEVVDLDARELENQSSSNCEKSICNDSTGIKRVSTSVDQCELVDKESNDMFMKQNNATILSHTHESHQLNVGKETMSKSSVNNKTISIGDDNKMSLPTERLRRRDRVCLERNSSKNMSFETTNDSEVQHILDVMKVHHDLVSPISKTPSDSHYLTLLPEMNLKLTKIWAAISHIYKTPGSNINSNLSEPNEIEIDNESNENEQMIIELPDIQTSRNNKSHQVNEVAVNRKHHENEVIQVERIEIVNDDTTNEVIEATCSLSEGIVSPKRSNIPISGNTNVIKLKQTDSEIITSIDLVQENKPDEVITTVDKEQSYLNQKSIGSYKGSNSSQNNIINTINTQTDNTEIFDVTESYEEVRKVKKLPKTKITSKLAKLRQKLAPACKIKKMDASITKRKSNTCNFKPLQQNSASLNQKLAYDKAVKVMAELRSKKERQSEVKLLSPVSESIKMNSNKIEPIKTDLFELKTRNRTRKERLSKTAEETTETVICQKSNSIEQNLRDTEKSPGDRRLRKRPADTEIDSLQGHKRILRSSVSHVNNEMKSPTVRQNKSAEFLHCQNSTKNKEKNNRNKNLNGVNILHTSDNDANIQNNKNINSRLLEPNNDDIEPKFDVVIEKGIRIMKPVIDISKRLTENDNAVSILPGNVGRLDFNAYTNVATTGSNDRTLGVRNVDEPSNRNESNIAGINKKLSIEDKVVACSNINSKYKNQITNKPQYELNKALRETEQSDSTKPTIERVSNSNNASGNEVMEPCNIEVQNEKISDFNDVQSHNLTKHDGTEQRNSYIRAEQSESVVQEVFSNTIKDTSKVIGVELGDNTKKLMRNLVVEIIPLKSDVISSCVNNIVNYSDLELYEENTNLHDNINNKTSKDSTCGKQNVLCAALDRYGVISVKYAAKKVPDTITNNISQKIEESIVNIIASSKNEQKVKMDQLVIWIQHHKAKHILSGLMKYLKDPTRKHELLNTVINGAAPPMTRSEMILLYVIEKLDDLLNSGFVERIWNTIEHALFQLNRAPEFCVIESMSHFYAVLCRYFRNKSRLRCFMLDAMYCLQFKAVPLIRQCLDVCPGVLPYAHENMAKTSLVTCLVYLLHFYKCQDKFNRAQDVRNILYRKYSYKFSEWNETVILEIFRKAIMDLRGTYNDKKMLRVALIILCKRHGAKWCQINIIQNMLLPIIEKKDVPERIKQFCVLMLGPLLKPFPADRKAQCEIVINQLLQMLKQDNSQGMTEAIYSSLIFMNKHDQERVVQALLYWNPEDVSPDFKEILNDYVMEKPLAVWKKLVTRKPSQCS